MDIKTILKEAWGKAIAGRIFDGYIFSNVVQLVSKTLDNLPDIEVGEDKPTEWRWEGYSLHTTNGVCKPKDWSVKDFIQELLDEKDKEIDNLKEDEQIYEIESLKHRLELSHAALKDKDITIAYKDAEIAKYQRREDEHCRQIDEMDKRRVIIGWRTLEKINREMAESGCPSCLLTPDEYGFI